MNRLVDADALKESFRKQTVNVQEKIKEDADAIIEAICKDVDLAPTVDAVQVVRCRECKWFAEFCDDYKQKSRKDGMCEHPTLDRYSFDTTFDFYCADGERRTNDHQGM